LGRLWHRICDAVATRHNRIGNHPVRRTELQAEFGRVQVVVLFASRYLAVQLAGIYNAERT
jgi:hypothetical protein